MWLKMALQLLPDSSWRLLYVDSPIGFRQPDCLVVFDDITKNLIGSIIDVSVWLVGDVQNGHGPIILSHGENVGRNELSPDLKTFSPPFFNTEAEPLSVSLPGAWRNYLIALCWIVFSSSLS